MLPYRLGSIDDLIFAVRLNGGNEKAIASIIEACSAWELSGGPSINFGYSRVLDPFTERGWEIHEQTVGNCSFSLYCAQSSGVGQDGEEEEVEAWGEILVCVECPDGYETAVSFLEEAAVNCPDWLARSSLTLKGTILRKFSEEMDGERSVVFQTRRGSLVALLEGEADPFDLVDFWLRMVATLPMEVFGTLPESSIGHLDSGQVRMAATLLTYELDFSPFDNSSWEISAEIAEALPRTHIGAPVGPEPCIKFSKGDTVLRVYPQDKFYHAGLLVDLARSVGVSVPQN